jgi:hypothetical protein
MNAPDRRARRVPLSSWRMPKIDECDFGRIVVDGVEHTRDVILLPGRAVLNWCRQDGHSLMLGDLAAVPDEPLNPDRTAAALQLTC